MTMEIKPSLYDPYTNDISFVELNKKRRRKAKEHSAQDSTKDSSVKDIFKIFIRRTGGSALTTKRFIWRRTKLENLCTDAGRRLGMLRAPRVIYDTKNGRVITDVNQIVSGNTYTFGYNDPVHHRHQKNTPTTSRTMSRIEFENTKEDRERQPRRHTNESFSLQRSVIESDSSENDDSEIATSVQNSSLCMEKLRLDESPETSRDKESAYEEKHMQDNFIFNRKDQTNPEAYIIYAFLNGHGTECQHVSFAKKQLKKGLVCMDGKYVRDVNDLMSRGAYVIIPTGQKFRETWYFLPDFAIDTSTTGEEIHKTKTDL